MTRLIVFYDARCAVCCAVREWIGRQQQVIPVECRPKQDDMDELVVVADSGEFWSGDAAWLMVLWALADYRSWSYRLASPSLLPTSRMFFAKVSKYRGSLSCLVQSLACPERANGSWRVEGPALSESKAR